MGPKIGISSKLPDDANMLPVRQPHIEQHGFKQNSFMSSQPKVLILPILLHWLDLTQLYLDQPTE